MSHSTFTTHGRGHGTEKYHTPQNKDDNKPLVQMFYTDMSDKGEWRLINTDSNSRLITHRTNTQTVFWLTEAKKMLIIPCLLWLFPSISSSLHSRLKWYTQYGNTRELVLRGFLSFGQFSQQQKSLFLDQNLMYI